jgi:hypothetical protein
MLTKNLTGFFLNIEISNLLGKNHFEGINFRSK